MTSNLVNYWAQLHFTEINILTWQQADVPIQFWLHHSQKIFVPVSFACERAEVYDTFQIILKQF